jgi:hypothetical protein
LVWATVLFCWRPVAQIVAVVMTWAGKKES